MEKENCNKEKVKKNPRRRLIIYIVVLALLILLVPIPLRLKDGGTLELRAILWEAGILNRLDQDPETGEPRIRKGFYLDILGMSVYDNSYLVEPE
ncbi:MAG: hypothetical protein J6P98_08970, partial [Clostridia bacterium]|nr:hypothetical protein [Clostridia bacterium]